MLSKTLKLEAFREKNDHSLRYIPYPITVDEDMYGPTILIVDLHQPFAVVITSPRVFER